MAACPRCGEANPSHARFCLACGAPLEEPATPREMRKTVTILFSDVIDSTPLGERLDAETYRRVISRYFVEVSRVLEHHGGTVEKFIGDAVMAAFGIPVVHEDDALRAVRAAGELREALARLNEELRAEYGVELATRTGINTGEVVAGDPAEGHSFATGEAVVVAQRLEAAASPGEILIGGATHRLVRDAVLVEPLEPLQLKGRTEPMEAWRLLAVVSGAPALARRLDAPMVGREEELAKLRSAFEQAVRGRECRLVTVYGTAGIGKSRLATEHLAEVRDEATVLFGRCLPYGEGITYWPLRDLVRDATGDLTRSKLEDVLAGDPDAERIAARVAAAIGIDEGSAAPEETAWAVRRLLEHLARQRPLIVGFDDLQWAEPAFLELVEYVLGWSRDAPLLIVCLARPELLDRRPTWLALGESVTLSPLSPPQAEELLEHLRGETEVGPDLLSRITDAAEGNPLFVEQMLAMLTENGAASGELAIPPSIHALLAARLDRLAPEERAVIEGASVIGKEFWRGAVAELLPEADRDSVGARLLRLARKELIEPARSIFPAEDGFRFRHILIRDAAYLGVPKEKRADLHERYAGWLERTERAGELDEIIGYHLEQAYRYRQELGPVGHEASAVAMRAGERLAAAGRRATSLGDVSAATSLITRAVELLPEDHPARGELLTELATALMRTGDFAQAEGVLTKAMDVATTAADRRIELRTEILQAFYRTFTQPEGSLDEIGEITERTIPLLQALDDDVGLANAWWLKSELYVNACLWGERAADLERALEHARRSGDAAVVAAITSYLSQAIYYGPTPVTEAIERCERHLAEHPDNRSLEASLTRMLGGLRAMQGEFDEARSLQERARSVQEELGQRFRIAIGSLVAAEIEQLAGRPGEAVAILEHAYVTLREMGVTSVTSTMAAFLADALCLDGRPAEAEEISKVSEELAAAEDVVTQVMWRCARARAIAQRDPDAAEKLAKEAVASAQTTDYPDLEARALLALAEVQGAGAEASRLLDDARRLYEKKGNLAAATRLGLAQAQPS